MNTTVPAGLRLASDTLDDLEALRIATGNRYGFATRPFGEKDADGIARGLGLDDRYPTVALAGATLAALEKSEHELILGLQREVRKTIFAGWVKAQKGVGEKQIARLLAVIGDPYVNESTGEPRTLRQLWAYTGHAVDNGAARRARKGMTQEELFTLGKPTAKMRAYLVATSCVKTKGNFRDIYDAEREHHAEAVHEFECKPCGPSYHGRKGAPPAPAGSPLSPGHQHARALRKVAKEVLRDLWLIARDYHQGE